MIGDIICPNTRDKRRAQKVVKRILSFPYKSVITISGGTGVRKSELANTIQQELYKNKKTSFVLCLDDYYKIEPIERDKERKRKGISSVGINEIDWERLEFVIKEYKDNFYEYGKLHFYEFAKYINSYIECEINKNFQYLIVEGLFANYLRTKNLSDLTIHIGGTPEKTLKFRKQRGKENEEDEFRKRVVEKEYEEVEKLKKYADIIIK